MRPMTCLRSAVLLSLPLLLAACHHYGRPDQPAGQLAFGVDMARHGLWSEALFRFHAAESLDPNNPRIQNNLGVAYEAAGQYDKALASYQKGLKLDPNSKEMRANYARFVEFYQGFKSDKPIQGTAGTVLPAPKPSEHRPPETPPPAGAPMGTPEPATPAAPPPPPPL